MAINLRVADWKSGDLGTALSVDVPAPNNVSVGDLITLCLNVKATGSLDGLDSGPTGFTLHVREDDGADWSPEINVYYKIAEAGDVTDGTNSSGLTYTFTLKDDWQSSYVSIVNDGHDAVTPLAGSSGHTVFSGSSVTIPSINVSAGNILVAVGGLGGFDEPVDSLVAPSGMTLQDEYVKTAVAEIGIAVATQEISADGTSGTKSWTYSVDSPSSGVLFQIQASDEFSNLSPEDGATGVSVTPELSINNPDSFANLNFRIASDSGFSNVIRDVFAQADSVTIADALEYLTGYYWNVRKYTPGSLVDAYLYEEYFETAQSGWDQWVTTQMQGTGSFSHTGGQGVVTSDPGGQVGAVLDVNFSDIDENFVIEFTDVTSDLQPTIHFRTQGTSWIGNFIPGYYIYFIGDEIRIGRVKTDGSPGDYSIANTTFVRTADTKYRGRIFTEGYRLRFAIWPITGSQNGWQIDYTDDVQRFASGGLAVKNAVLAGSATAEGMAFDYITVEGAQVEQEPESVDSVSVSPTSATIEPDSTTLITGDIQTSGGLSNTGTWTKVSGDADITIQSTSGNNVTIAASATASDTDSAVFRLTSDVDPTKWAETTVTVSEVTEVAGSKENDELAIRALWASTSGWQEDQGWGPNMSLDDDIWGVGVESIGGELRVVHMDLQRGTKTPPEPSSDPTNPFPGNEISGTLPSEIGNLTEIRYCNLKQNAFVGTLPSSMSNWAKCERLLIGGHTREPKLDFYNHPTGGGVSGQSKAIYTTNKFGGVSLPDIFGSMTSLKVFESQGHAVIDGDRRSTDPNDGWQGAIPNNWPASLQMLFLGWNNFTGNIPVGLTTTDLHVLHLNFNKLSGYVAPHLGNISTMTHVRLGSNNFSSDPAWTHGLPDEWAGFQNLRLMLLEFNDFSGTLPDFMFDGRNNWTEGFRCEFNNFSGTLPDVVNARGNYGSWNVLSFGQNNFSGQVPAWLTQLRVIQLNLDNNNFSSLHPDFYDPTSEIWSGYSSSTSYSRIRNIRLNNNPNLTGGLPRPDWLEPRNFNKCRSAGAIAHFGGTQLTQPGPTESGREYNASASDDGASGPIVQKTREDWYKHFWTSTQGI